MEYSTFKYDQDYTDAKIFYLVQNIHRCDTRKALLDWFTSRQRKTLTDIPNELRDEKVIILTGDPVEIEVIADEVAVHIPKKNTNITTKYFELSDANQDVNVYGTYQPKEKDDTLILFLIQSDASLPPFNVSDQFMLEAGMINNYQGEPTKTDVGKFFLNELLFVKVFGDTIPYKNERFKPDDLDDLMSKLILNGEITNDQYKKFIDNLFWFAFDGSIFFVAWTERAMIINPEIAKRKKELFEQYKDQLTDPNVMVKIEKELVDMDKAWIQQDDKADIFYQSQGKKSYNETRKKMWIVHGLATSFGDDENKYDFVSHSLDEGFTPETIPQLANSVRKGSYFRSKETAKGGEQTKIVLRAFQNVNIEEDDCHTKRGLPVIITKQNKKLYKDRWLVDGRLLTPELLDTLVGKEVLIRSPLYCATKPGFCYKCCGELFKKLDMKSIGMNELLISSTFMYTAMKFFHNSSISSSKIDDIHRFLR